MAYYLQSILGNKQEEKFFEAGLARLEKMAGNSGIDARLIADVIEKSHKVMRKLGLDIKDTTSHELYFALNSTVKHGTFEDLFIDTDYVLLMIDGEIVSFNLIDIIENNHHELPFNKRIVSHGQRSLRGELVGRYIDHDRTDEFTTLDVASLIGLLPDNDACYTKHKRKTN